MSVGAATVHRSNINATISTTGTPINQRRIGIENSIVSIAGWATCVDTIGSVATGSLEERMGNVVAEALGAAAETAAGVVLARVKA